MVTTGQRNVSRGRSLWLYFTSSLANAKLSTHYSALVYSYLHSLLVLGHYFAASNCSLVVIYHFVYTAETEIKRASEQLCPAIKRRALDFFSVFVGGVELMVHFHFHFNIFFEKSDSFGLCVSCFYCWGHCFLRSQVRLSAQNWDLNAPAES